MEERTDEQLIEAMNAGDIDAFGELYRRHRDWVLRLAWRQCGNRAEALDVLQDTFSYLLKKFPGFRLTARMTTFLYPVVKHLALESRRRRSREGGPVDVNAVQDEPAATPSDADSAVLAAAVARLPQAQREVLLMRFTDDMPLADIAEILDLPLGTVKSRLHHALKTLRENRALRRYFD